MVGSRLNKKDSCQACAEFRNTTGVANARGYRNNQTGFILGRHTVEVTLTTGVRQGDALSAAMFLLAAEPLDRAAKRASGATVYGGTAKTMCFADDIAVISQDWEKQQPVFSNISDIATTLKRGKPARKKQ